MTSKTETVYEKRFAAVCNAVRNNNGTDPDGFLANFETAATENKNCSNTKLLESTVGSAHVNDLDMKTYENDI